MFAIKIVFVFEEIWHLKRNQYSVFHHFFYAVIANYSQVWNVITCSKDNLVFKVHVAYFVCFFTTCHAQQVIIHFNTVISSNPHYLCVTLNLPSCILHFNYMVHCSSFMIENAFVALNFSNNKECNKFLFWFYCSVLYREWRWYFIAT